MLQYDADGSFAEQHDQLSFEVIDHGDGHFVIVDHQHSSLERALVRTTKKVAGTSSWLNWLLWWRHAQH